MTALVNNRFSSMDLIAQTFINPYIGANVYTKICGVTCAAVAIASAAKLVSMVFEKHSFSEYLGQTTFTILNVVSVSRVVPLFVEALGTFYFAAVGIAVMIYAITAIVSLILLGVAFVAALHLH